LVSILVHGIGDHDKRNLAAEARVGLQGVGGGNAMVEELPPGGLPKVQYPAHVKRNVSWLRCSEGEETHVVIPIVWSGVRSNVSRLSRWVGGSSGFNIVLALPVLLVILPPMGIDVIRLCSNRVRSTHRKLAVSLVFFVGSIVVFLLVMLAAVGLYVWVGGNTAVIPAPVRGVWGTELSKVMTALLVAASVSIAAAAAGTVEMAGDIVFYVARDRKRERLESEMVEFVQDVLHRAPSCRLVLIGHSLGSVLVSRVALTVSGSERFRGRDIAIVTMGSPINLMNAYAPSQFESAASLSRIYSASAGVGYWVNLYRTGDIVGRCLHAPSRNRFFEMEIGPGGHSGYWEDPMLWRAIDVIQEAAVSGAYEQLPLDLEGLAFR
jgi:hypothetical protein